MNTLARRLLLVCTAGGCLYAAFLGVSTSAQTSQPTTALSRAEQELLVQLSAADWRTRTAAGKSLLERPDITAAGLRAMLDQTASPEARFRLLAAMPTLIGRESIVGTPVTLHVSNAPAGWVVRQLFRQAHWPHQQLPEAFLQRISRKRVSVDADRQPFWSVLGTVLGQLHEWMYINPEVPITDSPFMVHGAIMVQPMQLSYLKNIALSDNAAEKDEQGFAMQLWGFCEPKVTIAETQQNLKVLEAVDDHGNSLVAGPLPDVRLPFSQGFLMDVVLNYPRKNPGSRLVRFRAVETVTLQMKSQPITIPDLLGAKPQVWQVGDRLVYFDGCTLADGHITGSIRTPDRGEDAEKRLMRDAQYHLQLRDKDGRALGSMGLDRRDDGKDLVLDFIYFLPAAQAGNPPPIALAWDPPAVTVDEDIPIAFDNLNIRIPGAADSPTTQP